MSNIINIAICDDENIQVELLEKYVKQWAEKNNIIAKIETFYSGEAFKFSWSMDKKYDILLLDIEMAKLNGVELAKKIRKEDDLLNIIFITAIPDYIGEGYNVDAINYLLKPIKTSKLYECLDKVVQKLPKNEKTVLIEVSGETIRLKQKDIIYVEAYAHSVDISTVNERYFAESNIGYMEKELDKDSFFRCHRSYIAGLRHIKKIGKTDIEFDNGESIPVSRRQYNKTNMAFIRYFKGDADG